MPVIFLDNTVVNVDVPISPVASGCTNMYMYMSSWTTITGIC